MRTLLKIAVVFVLLVAVMIAAATWYINSGRYRELLEETVAENTGYDLTIAGDVSLDIFPTFGLTLNDVRLRNPAAPQELASSSEMVLRVDVRELFGRRLLIRELVANDFHVNYYIDAEGNSLWDVPRPARDLPPGTEEQIEGAGAQSGGEPVTLTADRISIRNTSIDYQDLSQGIRYRVDDFNLESLDTNLDGRPFELAIDFSFENNGMSAPVPVRLRSNVIADMNNGNLNLNNMQFSVTPLLVQGEMSIINFDSNRQFSGNLRADPFDVRTLLETLALLEPESEFSPELDAMRMASFAMEFSGNETEATIPTLSLTLGDTAVEVDASLRFPTAYAPLNVSYNMRGGDVDLTPFLPASEEQNVADSEPTGEADIEIPVAALGALNLVGSASLTSLTVNDMVFRNVNVFTNIESSVLDIEITPVSAFEGSLSGAVRLNGQAETPTLEADFSANQVNLLDLTPLVSRFNSLAGRLDLEANHTARGTTVNEMLESLNGSTTFSVNNSSFDVTLIKQVFTAIAALSPTGEAIQQWPDVIRFSEVGGYVTLDEGLQVNQDIKIRMDNFDITGGGGINLTAGTFDYDFLFTVLGEPFTQTIPINQRYHDISWPVQCEAAFEAPASQYCRPDFTQVRQIFSQIGTNAVRDRLDEVITDQVPEEIEDTARGLLRNILN